MFKAQLILLALYFCDKVCDLKKEKKNPPNMLIFVVTNVFSYGLL